MLLANIGTGVHQKKAERLCGEEQAWKSIEQGDTRQIQHLRIRNSAQVEGLVQQASSQVPWHIERTQQHDNVEPKL